jgi:hypothetical protein
LSDEPQTGAAWTPICPGSRRGDVGSNSVTGERFVVLVGTVTIPPGTVHD